MKLIETPSPNFDERGCAIDMIVLHYTGMETGETALARLRDLKAKVSAHYLVEEDGRVFKLVEEDKRAWHAGVGAWRGQENINARSIGIEIVNPGHEFSYREFPDDQIGSLIGLMGEIRKRQHISPDMVVGHSDVAPMRKEDPGEKFPWDRLAKEGHCLGTIATNADRTLSYEDARATLGAIGYQLPEAGHVASLLAFQRRFCPAELGQGFNPATKNALKKTLEAVREAREG